MSVKYATEHRCGVAVSGPGLCDDVTGTDPLKDRLPLLQAQPMCDTPKVTDHALKPCNLYNAIFTSMLGFAVDIMNAYYALFLLILSVRQVPHYPALQARLTAALVNELSEEMRKVLETHPINAQRQQAGLALANVVLLRGCGCRIKVRIGRPMECTTHMAAVFNTSMLASPEFNTCKAGLSCQRRQQ